MNKTVIIVVTGMPGTGKTTLGKTLSEKYRLPFISKDALKERMFDTLGWNDKAWSLKVSAASHRVMDYIIEEELRAGHSIIVESNFKQSIDSERFRGIQAQYGCEIVQILCWAEGEVVFDRFMGRIENAVRHQGHVEEMSAAQIRQEFVDSNGKDIPLDVEGDTVELNTTDLDVIDYTLVYKTIERALSK
jgi:predicted kinase